MVYTPCETIQLICRHSTNGVHSLSNDLTHFFFFYNCLSTQGGRGRKGGRGDTGDAGENGAFGAAGAAGAQGQRVLDMFCFFKFCDLFA